MGNNNKDILTSMHVTIEDRLKRELNIIETIFKSQYFKDNDTIQYPYIIGIDGHGVNGRFINSMKIVSDVELLNIQLYKSEFSKRYENTNNHLLLKNQLLEIRGMAVELIRYYNENLTSDSEIVKEFINQRNQNQIICREHIAVITISNYFVLDIFLGTDKAESFKHNYNYLADNYFFAEICQSLIEFIDKFGFSQDKQSELKDNHSDQQRENPLIFEKSILDNFHGAFNGNLWESTDIEIYKNWFRVNPIGKPIFKPDMITYFCYAFGKIEDKIIEVHRPKNLNNWIKPIINGNNYSGLKNRKNNKQKTAEIDGKISLIK